MVSTNETCTSVPSHGTSSAATTSAPTNHTFTNNAALLLLFLILLLIHSAGFSDAKQLISASRSISSSSLSSSSTMVPIVQTATTTMVPKPEHKTYPDQNVLVGRVAHLPCHMSGQFSDQQPEPLQESEDESAAPYGTLYSQSAPLPPSAASSQTATSTSASSLEMIQLILWYHGDDISGSPFYSVDARVNHHHHHQQQQQQQNQILLKNQSDSSSSSSSFSSSSSSSFSSSSSSSSSSLLSPINQWKHFLVDPYNERAKFVVNHFQNHHQQPLLHKNANNVHQHYLKHRQSSFISGQNSGPDHHHNNQSPFTLIIDPVLESDQGLYWCRVDYRWTRTTISKVRLNVYVPPKVLTIYQLEPPPLSSILPSPLFSNMDGGGGVNFESTKNNNKNNIEEDGDDNINLHNFYQPTTQQLESNLMVQFIDQLNQILANNQTTTKDHPPNADSSATSAKMFFPLNLIKITITPSSSSSSPRTLLYNNTSGQFDSSTTSSANTYHYNYPPLNSKHQHQQQQQPPPSMWPPKAIVDESIESIFMCQSSGGNPTPTIQWYWNNRRLPVSVEVVSTSTSTSTNRNGTLFAKILPKSSDSNGGSSGGGGGKFHVINLGLVQDPSIFSKLFKIRSNQQQEQQEQEQQQLNKPIVLSFLWLQNMERSDLGVQIRCQSSNAPQVPLSKSLSTVMRLEINLNPIKAQIVDLKRDGLFSGSTIHATCLTWGSKPAARIFWFLDDRQLMDVSETVFESNFTTKSQVRLIIHSDDNGRTLTCLAIRLNQNPMKNWMDSTTTTRIHSSLANNHSNIDGAMTNKNDGDDDDDFNVHRGKQAPAQQPESDSKNLQLLLSRIIKQILSSKPSSFDKNGQKMRDSFLKNHHHHNNNNDNDSKRKTGSKKIENYDDDDLGARLLINNKTRLLTNTNNNPFFKLPFVHDQMTLMVEYLPNITIDLLETAPITTDNVDVVDDTRRPDGVGADDPKERRIEEEILKTTKTMNENIDSERRNGGGGPHPRNRNRKIYVKHYMKLRCLVDANPSPYRIRWLLNHRDISTLLPSNEYRLTDDNRTLSIDGPPTTGIGHRHEGTYQCSAFNQLGRGDSNELLIAVLRAPKCVFKSENRKTKSTKSSRTMMMAGDSGVNVDVGSLPAATAAAAANVESRTQRMTKIDSNINYPANLFCQVDATLPSSSSSSSSSTSSFSSSMIDDRIWIYWQLPNNPNFLLTVDQRGRLLSIPKDKLDLFRRKRLRQRQRQRKQPKHPKQAESGVYGGNGNGNYFEDVVDAMDSDYDLMESDPTIDNNNDNRRLVLATNNVRSRLTIIPQSEQDFGLYQCWAENAFGSNRDEPCLFNLTNSVNPVDQRYSSRNNHQQRWPWSSGVPAPVTNCTTNYSSITGVISLRCQHHQDRRDRTHQQTNDRNDRNLQFHLILKKFLMNHHHHNHHHHHYDNRKTSGEMNSPSGFRPVGTTSQLSSILINQTNPIEPYFLISNLQPSSIYEAMVFASNDYGNSSQLRLLIKLENVSLDHGNESTTSVITSVHQQPQHDIRDGQENRNFQKLPTSTNDYDDGDGDDSFDSFESFIVASSSSSSSSSNYPVFNDYDDDEDEEDNGVGGGGDDHLAGHRRPIIVGKPDLHQQQNSFTQFNERKNGFYSGLLHNNNHNDDNNNDDDGGGGGVGGVDGGSDSLNRWPNLATKIPLSSSPLDHRHGGDHHNLNDHHSFQMQNNNRFVLIIIIVFTIVLITFSALLSIAIGFCLYRRKRSILIRRHQEQLRQHQQKQQQQSQQPIQNQDQDQDQDDSLIITDGGGDGGEMIRKTSPLKTSHTTPSSSTYETYPLDDHWNATGVFILDTSGGNTSIGRTPTASAASSGQAGGIGGPQAKHSPLDTSSSLSIHHHPLRPMMIYRDFVTSPPSSSTSPLLQPPTNIVQPQPLLHAPDTTMYSTTTTTTTPEFLYQPTTGNVGEFLDLAMDSGNVQLIPSTNGNNPHPHPHTFLSYSNTSHETSLLSSSSPLNIDLSAHNPHRQSSPSMFCLNPITTTTEMDPGSMESSRVMIPSTVELADAVAAAAAATTTTNV